MLTLKMFLEEQPTIPWDALLYVTGQIHYGGRVTDDLDRRCLMSILKKYYLEAVLDDAYRFTPSGVYYAPEEGDLTSFRQYINDLPLTEAPEVFGMHPNADITFQMQETRKMMDSVLSIQPRRNQRRGGQEPRRSGRRARGGDRGSSFTPDRRGRRRARALRPHRNSASSSPSPWCSGRRLSASTSSPRFCFCL